MSPPPKIISKKTISHQVGTKKGRREAKGAEAEMTNALVEKAGGGLFGPSQWFHRNIGRMETEKLLIENREDGSFLIRESDTVKGAYVLSTM